MTADQLAAALAPLRQKELDLLARLIDEPAAYQAILKGGGAIAEGDGAIAVGVLGPWSSLTCLRRPPGKPAQKLQQGYQSK